MATIKDVSRLAGVSIATVSRVVNNSAPVNEATRERVYQAMQELGYTPNVFAQGLVTRRSNTIGLVLPGLQGAFFSRLITAIESTLREQGISLVVSVGNTRRDLILDAITKMRAQRCDGIMLSPHCLGDDDLLSLFDSPVPLVLLNRSLPEHADVCVSVDNREGGRMMTDYLIRRGHRRIACITGPMLNMEARHRLEGYRTAMRTAGLDINTDWIVEGNFEMQGGFEAVQTLMQRKADVTALFIGNDQMAVGALRAYKAAGIRIPEQISMGGFDDDLYTDLLDPALTTLHQPLEEMGQAAAHIMLHRLGLRKQPVEQTIFSPTLVERASVAAPVAETA
ncbi:MAG: LacI family transcriptional regulator [Gammaproteobacteria bacterium]|nr:MAG: LacI family transcriptional regulator [Gammaproteobacteria bacterium]